MPMDKPTKAREQPNIKNTRIKVTGIAGSWRPSMSGNWPSIANRATWMRLKEMASAKISFSASEIISCTIIARLPGRPLVLASSLSLLRKMPVIWKSTKRTIVVMTTGRNANKGLLLNVSRCCMAPPAEIAAKPPMCASNVLQALFWRQRLSYSTAFFTTAISKPYSLSTATLFVASMTPFFTARTFCSGSGTTSSKLQSMASA
mmetsp:Transcript_141547/g.452503  ORF Transcript_141547/g.452503 Transcript_141547/m.452503 type:complete len:204 (-) Transcript_141547:409-1020(-)